MDAFIFSGGQYMSRRQHTDASDCSKKNGKKRRKGGSTIPRDGTWGAEKGGKAIRRGGLRTVSVISTDRLVNRCERFGQNHSFDSHSFSTPSRSQNCSE
ncbi:hypothetical protein TNCT_209791 [Trichonephila clavata]|uniref:Uncharacterized protein n=1 Tax=Trichonephila clavata TaxID=2740835 RepID=A0A8X6KS01_TRICU|nr:hypothetical protein TNCT_209791 [Trichonephila clavata]